jgi:hypothetical protein
MRLSSPATAVQRPPLLFSLFGNREAKVEPFFSLPGLRVADACKPAPSWQRASAEAARHGPLQKNDDVGRRVSHFIDIGVISGYSLPATHFCIGLILSNFN